MSKDIRVNKASPSPSSGASIRPSEFQSAPQPLDTSSKRQMAAVAKLTIDEFSKGYLYPPPTPNGYLDVSYIPVVWSECCELFSRQHVFAHSFSLAHADEELASFSKLRDAAKMMCRQNGDACKALWLRSRPKYQTLMITDKSKVNFPAWDWETKKRECDFSKSSGFTARHLLLVYGCRSMLTSTDIDLMGYRSEVEREWENWRVFLRSEKAEIERVFSFK